MRLTDDLDRIRAELRVREVRAEQEANLQQTRVADQLSQLQARVNGPAAAAEAAAPASVDIPGVAHGDSVRSLSSLTDVVNRKAKSMPVTRGNPNHQLIASVR